MDDSKMHKLNGVIEHYKRHIGRATESNDNDKIMKCITKLSRLPITVQNLQNTGIGRVVNNLRKYDGNIGESAKSLVIQWKNVVKIEETENFYKRDDNSDEEHHDVSSPKDNEEFINEPEVINTINDDSSDHESSHHRHHEKSKHKKSKKDKDNKKRKESYSNSTDEQGDGHISKKVKKDYKYENVKIKTEPERCETVQHIATTSYREHINGYEESTKKEKKSSHSNKKKDKHKSSHKSESKSHSHRDKHESKSGHKDKSDSKKNTKDKTKEESKPSTSTNHSTHSSNSSNKTFEEALLGIEIVKKKQIKSKYRDRSRSSERESSSMPPSPLAPFNLDPEELIANYKPLSQLDEKKKKTEDLDPLAKIMTTKNMRTKVYSGNKSTIYTEVPRLLDFCIQTIKDNLDALEYTGGVPFSILEPILKHASPDQLYTLEQFNDYLIEDTGVLWEYHCKKEFRNKIPDKNESWRNFYIRCLEERETKLAKLRRNINANQAASMPVRKTQLAYVDSTVKPPRGIAKKQAKFQTASADTRRNILNKSMMGEHSTAEALSANKKSTSMATGVPIALTSAHSPSSAMKKKKAPLMQKALQLIKSTRRR